jgi:hypothetical protein
MALPSSLALLSTSAISIFPLPWRDFTCHSLIHTFAILNYPPHFVPDSLGVKCGLRDVIYTLALSLHAVCNWPKVQLGFEHFAKFGNLTKLPRLESYLSNNWNNKLKRLLVILASFLPIQVNVESTPPCIALHFNGPCPHLPSVPGSMGASFYLGNTGWCFKLC